ncbi:hypothetical protein L6452_02814 [Arctium lappa]|uniref:Uncharacterized protein n=1 Tax=Arctium lappa TaxID=4217 RepID=A0ACB9FLH7_ARCLA|nr:hypothetical protein L6452_02814 [Arctium lappa]
MYLVGDSFGGCLALAVVARNPTIDLVVILANPGIEGKTFVVTGGLRFVGSALCLELLRRVARLVRVFDLRSNLEPWRCGEQMGRNGDVQESLWKSNPSKPTPQLSPISTMGHGRQL